MAARRLAETQPESFAFTAENRAWAEREMAKFPEGRQASAVISLLWRAQEQEGWVTKPAIEHVAKMLEMPLIRVLEVATFYTMFHLEPVGAKAHIQVCGTTPCMLRGAGDLIAVCRERIHHDPHHLSADGAFSWEEVECLGACVNAPMIQVSKDTYEDLTPEIFEELIDAFARGETPAPGPQIERQYSMPITGLTSLKEIEYAADDLAPPRPRTALASTGGGGLGIDPATPAAANQHAGRVDPSGRADEAAARAPGASAGTAPKAVSDAHQSGPRNPGATSDRDSESGGGKS
jgi:NADH-quinone oxidoreductase subunit E